MRINKALVAVALAAGIASAVPATVSANSAKRKTEAQASGDPVPVLPSAVRSRLKRGANAIDKAGEYVDKGQPDKAVNSLRGARANMYSAWRAAKYGIVHAPAPPAEDKVVADAAQDDAVGTLYATPEETAIAVLGYQHDVFVGSLGLLDDAKGPLRDALSTTMFAALDRRDSAIQYISTLTPAVPPEDKVVANAADEVPTWDVLMPGLFVDLDDEQAAANELLDGGSLTPGEKRIVRLALTQSVLTENTVNTYWPAVVED